MTKRAEKRMKMRKDQESPSQQTPRAESQPSSKPEVIESKPATLMGKIYKIYDEKYKTLMWIPIILIMLSILQIGYQVSTSEDHYPLIRDISLKGGVTITVPVDGDVDLDAIQKSIASKGIDANVRDVQSSGKVVSFIVESGIDLNDKTKIDALLSAIDSTHKLVEGTYSVEGIGSTIGESFFKQAMVGLILSFILMSLIVTFTFKSFIPSAAIITAAASDILMTLALVNMLGIKISTAGFAAFLMLIGYSVDTDILLTTRVLKRTEGTIMSRVMSSVKTGMLMSWTTVVASGIAMIVTSSEVVGQIMLIIFIGVLFDQINTWIQNVGILRLYLEHQNRKKQQ